MRLTSLDTELQNMKTAYLQHEPLLTLINKTQMKNSCKIHLSLTFWGLFSCSLISQNISHSLFSSFLNKNELEIEDLLGSNWTKSFEYASGIKSIQFTHKKSAFSNSEEYLSYMHPNPQKPNETTFSYFISDYSYYKMKDLFLAEYTTYLFI